MSCEKLLETCENLEQIGEALFGAPLPVDNTKEPPFDLEYYQLTDHSFAKQLEAVKKSLLNQINVLASLCKNQLNSDVSCRTEAVIRTPFTPIECTEKMINNLQELPNFVQTDMIDLLDSCYEQFDTLVDRKRIAHHPILKPTTISKTILATANEAQVRLIQSTNIPRPQLAFTDLVDNSSAPFISKLKIKPHALVPLDLSTVHTQHPYQHEISHLKIPAKQLKLREATPALSIDSCDFIWVENFSGLEALLHDLKQVDEIAVDLEHHSYRSFQGFTCLLQISTRSQDYLIDALVLRSQLYVLNEVFADPKIVKVFHGSEHDILWLQKDFGLYVVNLFDTFACSNVLELGGHSLAFLLSEYLGIHVDKKYQLADWRMRPLPKEMARYAQADTHYLLHLYDLLRNQLLQNIPKNEVNENSKSNPTSDTKLLRRVMKRSNDFALKFYEKDIYDVEESWKNTYYKYAKSLTTEQLFIFKALHQWRDQVAREEDESTGYVMPNNLLFVLAEKMPIESQRVVEICQPMVPPLVRQHATDLSLLIFQKKREFKEAAQESSARKEQETATRQSNIQYRATEIHIPSAVDDENLPLEQNVSEPSALMQTMNSSLSKTILDEDRRNVLNLVKSKFITKFLDRNREYLDQVQKTQHEVVSSAVTPLPAREEKILEVIEDDEEDEELKIPTDFDSILKPGQVKDCRYKGTEVLTKKPKLDEDFVPFDYNDETLKQDIIESHPEVETQPTFNPYGAKKPVQLIDKQKATMAKKSLHPGTFRKPRDAGNRSMTFKMSRK